jgi:hypothetical protein
MLRQRPGRLDVLSVGPIPPFGTVMIDLATAVPLPLGFLDVTGRATIVGLCPNVPALVGASLWWQAVMYSENRVTGIEETKFLGL